MSLTLTRERITESLRQIIADHFGFDIAGITPATDLTNDLHADSLDYIMFLMEFEDQNEVSIPDRIGDLEFEKCITFNDAVDYICKSQLGEAA